MLKRISETAPACVGRRFALPQPGAQASASIAAATVDASANESARSSIQPISQPNCKA